MEQKMSLSDLSHFSTSVIIFNRVDVSYVIKKQSSLKDWIALSIKKERKKLGEISFNICSDEYLLSVNKEHLNHDYYTDIITFDFCSGNIISGDIYISIDRVKENAKLQKQLIGTELCRVIIHGILHLCGYKDKKPADALLMRQKEDYYLSLLSK